MVLTDIFIELKEPEEWMYTEDYELTKKIESFRGYIFVDFEWSDCHRNSVAYIASVPGDKLDQIKKFKIVKNVYTDKINFNSKNKYLEEAVSVWNKYLEQITPEMEFYQRNI